MVDINKLSPLKVTKERRQGYYNDGGGLYLRIGPNGSKSWVFRFKVTANARTRTREMGLGSIITYTLAEARERARDCRKLRDDGIDPIDRRRQKKQGERLDAARAMTFQTCAEAYIAAHQAGWGNAKHAAQWPSSLAAYAYPVLGKLPVPAIDVSLIMKAIEPIWVEKAETASRVRGRIEAVLDWATTRGYRTGENPARWRGHLENLLPKKSKVTRVAHHAALAYSDLPAFFAELKRQNGIAARALEFTILTVARTGEAIGARWSEIDLAERVWTVPGERMKAGKVRRTPLSQPAVAILERMTQLGTTGFVFPDSSHRGRPISSKAMLLTLRRMGRNEITTHGFRSSFVDWATETTDFPTEARELMLAHSVGTKVEQAYRRGTLLAKRRQLAEVWGRYLNEPVHDTKVTPIRG
jgi:integrase